MSKIKFKLELFLSDWKKIARKSPRSEFKKKRGKIDMICHCGNHYQVWPYVLKQGNGLSCSRSCASFRRFHNLPAGQLDTSKMNTNAEHVPDFHNYYVEQTLKEIKLK